MKNIIPNDKWTKIYNRDPSKIIEIDTHKSRVLTDEKTKSDLLIASLIKGINLKDDIPLIYVYKIKDDYVIIDGTKTATAHYIENKLVKAYLLDANDIFYNEKVKDVAEETQKNSISIEDVILENDDDMANKHNTNYYESLRDGEKYRHLTKKEMGLENNYKSDDSKKLKKNTIKLLETMQSVVKIMGDNAPYIKFNGLANGEPEEVIKDAERFGEVSILHPETSCQIKGYDIEFHYHNNRIYLFTNTDRIKKDDGDDIYTFCKAISNLADFPITIKDKYGYKLKN